MDFALASPASFRSAAVSSISVIVPTYNSAHYLTEALESIRAQTVMPTEIIVVDDGSTDETQLVIERMDDPLVRYMRQANGGAASARNAGLAKATGEYIAFLDADDRWHPEMLETQLGILEGAPQVALSFTNFERFEERSGQILGDQFRYYHGLRKIENAPGPLPNSFVIRGDAFNALVSLGDFPAFTQVILFRRSAIANLCFNPALRRCEDLAFTLLAAMHGGVAYTPRILAQVRRHGANLTADSSRMALDKLRALETLSSSVVLPNHVVPYRNRMVRAHLDAARTHLRFAELSEGLGHLVLAWKTPGALRRKMKGTVRVFVELPSALLRRAMGARG